jgi:hypothetical protein
MRSPCLAGRFARKFSYFEECANGAAGSGEQYRCLHAPMMPRIRDLLYAPYAAFSAIAANPRGRFKTRLWCARRRSIV